MKLLHIAFLSLSVMFITVLSGCQDVARRSDSGDAGESTASMIAKTTAAPAGTSERRNKVAHVTVTSVALDKIATNIDDIENIPVYPGSYQVEIDSRELPQAHTTSFHAPASSTQVVEYYLDSLAEKEWEIKNTYPTLIIAYWSDKSRKVPWKLFLTMGLYAPTDQTTRITIYVSRWPDPNNVPIYPAVPSFSAQDVVGEDGYVDRLLTYTVSAKPEQVYQFYRDTLVQYGWHKGEWQDGTTQFSGVYYYGRGDES